MNQIWTCQNCNKTEKTSSRVSSITHSHGFGAENVQLIPYKKPRKQRGVDTVKSMKKEAREAFQLYIRVSNSDENGYCTCVTCSKTDHYKNMDAGHWIHGKNATLFDTRNVHVQCKSCNGFKHSNAVAYKEFMLKTYGQKIMDTLEWLSKRPHPLTVWELKRIRDNYKKKLEGIE